MRDHDGDALAALGHVIEGGKLASDTGLARLAAEAGERLGLSLRIYLVDLRQVVLVPFQVDGEPLPIDGTLAGRAFRLIEPVPVGDPAEPRLWFPLMDGVERLGVLDVSGAPGTDLADERLHRTLRWVGSVLGHLIGVKGGHGDAVPKTRRTERMTVAGELLRSMLPPTTFGVDGVVVTGVIEPCYDVGGDSFDYSVDDDLLRFAVVDAMGHSLRAGAMSATAVAAYRAARRAGHGLYDTVRTVDTTLAEQYGEERFATGFVAELSRPGGLLRYVNAGHPAPLLLRAGKVVKTLEGGARLPLGFDDAEVSVAEESFQPGDALLVYTDGVVEARDATGEFFGVARLVDFVEREAATRQPAPEVLRRLVHAVLAHQAGTLQDDATLFLVEWAGAGARQLIP